MQVKWKNNDDGDITLYSAVARYAAGFLDGMTDSEYDILFYVMQNDKKMRV